MGILHPNPGTMFSQQVDRGPFGRQVLDPWAGSEALGLGAVAKGF